MRMCDHWPVRSPLSVDRQIEKHKRAIKYAEMMEAGATAAGVGRLHGIAGDQVLYVLSAACPPFLPLEWSAAPAPEPKPFKPPPEAYEDERPAWTRPGGTLLKVAREARAEIEASGWFGRRDDHAA